MNFILRTIAICLGTLAGVPSAWAQTGASSTLRPDTVALLQAQEKQSSRFSQEVFSRYVQVAYDRDLLEKEGSTYTAKGSIFALGGIFRDDFNALSTRQGTKFSRSFALEIGAKTGKQFKLSDGVVGFTWALVDHRNAFLYRESDANEIRNQVAANRDDRKSQADFAIKVEDVRRRQGNVIADAMAQERIDALNTRLHPTSSDREKALKAVYDKYQVASVNSYTVETVTEALKNRGLLTFYGRGYTDFNKLLPTQAEIGFQYVKGFDALLAHPSAWQFDIKTFLALRPDSTIEHRNLQRSSIITKAGINRVLIMAADGKQSFLEAKLDLGNEYRTGNIFPTEDRNTFYGEAALRIRVSTQFWVPLALKYDINNGNVFGFLKAVWNISPAN
jgi:hypothetical protein